MKAPKFRDFISEKVQRRRYRLFLTKVDAIKNIVSKMIEAECKRKYSLLIINTSEAWVSKNDLEKGTLFVSNIDGEDRAEFELSKTICLPVWCS